MDAAHPVVNDGSELNRLSRVQPLRVTDPGRLGRYRVLGRLGQGGMGVVYLAEDPRRRLVAIKLVHAHLAGDPEFLGRFRSEVNRAREVPAFCTAEVLDADLSHSPPFLVVEYVDGPSLAEVIEERGPLSPARLHSLAVGVATALAGIHGAGVIHRDLKPQNVLLAPGSPKVIDFGIARALEATSGRGSEWPVTDFRLELTAAVLTSGACLVVWPGWSEKYDGPTVEVCRDRVSLGRGGREYGVTPPVPLGRKFAVQVAVREGQVTVFYDKEGKAAMKLPAGTVAGGRQVRIGMTGPGRGQVNYYDADLWGL